MLTEVESIFQYKKMTIVDTRALVNFLLKIAYNRAHSFGEMNGKKFTISLKIIPKLAYTR